MLNKAKQLTKKTTSKISAGASRVVGLFKGSRRNHDAIEGHGTSSSALSRQSSQSSAGYGSIADNG